MTVTLITKAYPYTFAKLSCLVYSFHSSVSLQQPTQVVMGEQWGWKKVNGEMKLEKTQVKGYIIDPFAGLRVTFICIDKENRSHVHVLLVWVTFLGTTEQSCCERGNQLLSC